MAVVALPLALVMDVTSGAGPIADLYGAIFVGFFAALFGGTPAVNLALIVLTIIFLNSDLFAAGESHVSCSGDGIDRGYRCLHAADAGY